MEDDLMPDPYCAERMRAFDALPLRLRRFVDTYPLGVPVLLVARAYWNLRDVDEVIEAIRDTLPVAGHA